MEVSNKSIFLIICVIILFAVIIYQNKNNSSEYKLERFENINDSQNNSPIIKKLCQTYHNKDKIPEKVFQNIQKFLPDFEHNVFDDADCLAFLEEFDKKYGKTLLNNKSTVENFKIQKTNAHKADIFRYCYLYENGGLYADIKTIFIKPITELQLQNNLFYSVIDLSKKAIYQGVIYSPAKNKLFLDNIHFILNNPNPDYSRYIQYLYESVKKHSINQKVKPGLNKMKDMPDIYLFEETSFDKKECNNELDRYKLCSFITDKNKMIIRTRYSDYPWKNNF